MLVLTLPSSSLLAALNAWPVEECLLVVLLETGGAIECHLLEVEFQLSLGKG